MGPEIPFRASPIPAFPVAQPFDRPGWTYEEKYDGERMLAYKEGRSAADVVLPEPVAPSAP